MKQVIVWRSDLQNVPLGKKMAQAGHASHMFLTHKLQQNTISLDNDEIEWLNGEHKKIVLSVKSEADLLLLHEKAKELGLRSYLVQDNAHTVFNEPTITCLAIGPNVDGEIDKITGENGPLGKIRLA